MAWIVVTSGRAEAAREVVAGHRDEPVVAVHEVEVEAVAELDAGGEHVGVHPLDPGDELAQVGGPRRLADAVDADAARRSSSAGDSSPPRVSTWTSMPELDERLGELADVAGEAALDQRRVLPGEDQDSGHGRVALGGR